MKKKNLIIILLFISVLGNSCANYKPIFNTNGFKFYIEEQILKGDKKLGNKIYTKLYNISNSNKDENVQSISIIIQVGKSKFATVKDRSGKILEYKINLNTNIVVNDFLNGEKILKKSFNYDYVYKVQEQYFETLKLENKAIENLIEKTYQNLLIEISENITTS